MAQPWKTIDNVNTADGKLELRQRGERDFLIMVGSQVLMNSLANRSEVMLGKLGCRHLQDHSAPRVLVGGLGMGYTLRAVLDSLPATAEVTVAELNPAICDWCRGALAPLTDGAVADPRVSVEIGDVADLISSSTTGSFDAVILDLYRGPHAGTDPRNDRIYGSRAINSVRAVLTSYGVLAVWGEQYDAGFEKRLQTAGFWVKVERPGRGGLRHAVFIAGLQ